MTDEEPDLTPKPGRCGARTRTDGHACRKGAGAGTDHPGLGRCSLHLGSTGTHQVAAAREQARGAVAKLGIPIHVDRDPVTVLQDAVDSASSLHAALSAWVRDAAADPEPDVRRLGAQIDLYGQAIDRAAKVAATAVSANLGERSVRLAEGQAAAMVATLRAALKRSGIPADSRAAVERAIAYEMREMSATYQQPARPLIPAQGD